MRLLFILPLLSASGAFAQEAAGSLPELVRRIKPSAVAIETFDSRDEKLARGSGFFIAPDRVITNRHVIEKAHRAEVHLTSGNVYKVRGVLAVDGEGDIALLQVEIPLNIARPLTVDRTSPQEGESIVVIGNPFGLEGSVSNGIVSAVREIPNFGRIIQITAPISPGSSGSPVVNMQGQVIGVATYQLTDGQSLNFAVPSERVLQLQSGKLSTLSDLVVATSKNKRATAERFYMQGLGFLSKDEREKALPYFKKAVDADPAYADAWYQIGYCNVMLGRHDEALKASRQALTLKPNSPESYIIIGYAHFDLKQYAEAIEAYRKAISLDPNNPDAYYTLGVAYGKSGRTEKEVQAYREVIRLKPDYTSAYERMGAGLLRLNRDAEAAEAFNQLISLRPDDSNAHYNLGLTYLKMNRTEEAIKALLQAINLKWDFARARFSLGKAYLSLGDRDSALGQCNYLKTLDADLAHQLCILIDHRP